MEVEEFFEEWEDDEWAEFIEEAEEDGEIAVQSEEDCIDSESDSGDEGNVVIKCSKCKKPYHLSAWLKKHEESCQGKRPKNRGKPRLSEHQKKTRTVLSSLGCEEFFSEECVPSLVTWLQKISSTGAEAAGIRGSRFISAQLQAEKLKCQLEKEEQDEQVTSFFRLVCDKVWSITFARDDLVSSSKRHQDVAQHLNQFRQDEALILKWTELCRFLRLGSVDTLLLQMMITQIFEDISSFRQRSVVDALKIRQEYAGETSIKPSLTTVERNVIGYIAGYVCRKTRDRLQRSNSEKFSRVLSVLIQRLPSMKTAPAAMSFPNLMSLSLSRGGLSLVDYSIFNFFCYVEVSIRPFLNLARFRCSTRRSDTELLDQLIHNSPLLNQTWPFTTILSSEDNNVLLKLFVYLYFRVRKWSYLKTYKEERKVKEKKCSAGNKDLHGKDSIRKALMSSSSSSNSDK